MDKMLRMNKRGGKLKSYLSNGAMSHEIEHWERNQFGEDKSKILSYTW